MKRVVRSEETAVRSCRPAADGDRSRAARMTNVQSDGLAAGLIRIVDVDRKRRSVQVISVRQHLVTLAKILHSGKEADRRRFMPMHQTERRQLVRIQIGLDLRPLFIDLMARNAAAQRRIVVRHLYPGKVLIYIRLIEAVRKPRHNVVEQRTTCSGQNVLGGRKQTRLEAVLSPYKRSRRRGHYSHLPALPSARER